MKKIGIKAWIGLLLCLLLTLTGCTGSLYGGLTEREDGLEGAYTETILPESRNAAYGNTVRATLYFRYLSEDYLAGTEQEITVTAETTPEEQVVLALIAGPQDEMYQFNSLINPDTELISVKEQSGYLSVTLSDDFLENMGQNIEEEETRRRLAVQSIVDSVLSLGNYSRVLLLVDESGSGNGQRLTYAQAGWEDKGERTMEPMAFDSSVVLTPENVMDIALRCVVEQDYERLSYYLSETDYDGTSCPSRTEIEETLQSKVSIVSYDLENGVIASGGSDHAIALLNLTYIDSGGQTSELSTVPVRILYGDVWQVSFLSLASALPEY